MARVFNAVTDCLITRQLLPLGDEGVGFGNQHLRQHSPSAFSCDFGQWIIDRLSLTERHQHTLGEH